MVDRVRITAGSGRVQVIGESRDGVDVSGAETSGSDTELEVRGKSKDVTVRVPTGTDVIVGSSSGDVELTGALGDGQRHDGRVLTSTPRRSRRSTRATEVRQADGRRGPRFGAAARRRAPGSGSAGPAVRSASPPRPGGSRSAKPRDAVSIKTVSGDIDVTVTGTGAVSRRDGVGEDHASRSRHGCAAGRPAAHRQRQEAGRVRDGRRTS